MSRCSPCVSSQMASTSVSLSPLDIGYVLYKLHKLSCQRQPAVSLFLRQQQKALQVLGALQPPATAAQRVWHKLCMMSFIRKRQPQVFRHRQFACGSAGP